MQLHLPLDGLPPEASAGHAAWRSLSALVEELRATRRGVLRGGEPEALHDLRVALSRLRAVLGTFGAFLRLPPRASEERLITLTRALGRLRNADVSSALLAPVAATTKGREADRLAEVLDALDLERRQESRRTRVLLRRPRTLRTIGELRDWLEAPAFVPGAETPLAVAVGPILLRIAADLETHPGWGIPALQAGESAAAGLSEAETRTLHGLRRAVKRTRYQLEAGAPDDPEAVARAAALHRIQDALGRLQDLAVAERRLRQLGEGYPERLPVVARFMLRAQRDGLEDWDELRARASWRASSPAREPEPV